MPSDLKLLHPSSGCSEVCIPKASVPCSQVAPELSLSEGRTPRVELFNSCCTRTEHPQRCGVFALSFVKAAQLTDNLGMFKYSECLCPSPVFPQGSY